MVIKFKTLKGIEKCVGVEMKNYLFSEDLKSKIGQYFKAMELTMQI